MTAIERNARVSTWLVAAIVLGLTFTCARRAWAAGAVPNQAEFRFNLAEGQQMRFRLAVSNSPVILSVSGTTTAGSNRNAFAQVTHHTGTGRVSWIGLDALSGPVVGDSNTTGEILLFLTPHVVIRIDQASATARQLALSVSEPGFETGMAGVVQQIW